MTNTINAAPPNATSLTFAGWGGAISQALTDIGCYLVEGPKLTATNAPTTWGAAGTSGTNTEKVYEVWRLDDPGSNSVENAQPLYIRLGYGGGSSTGSVRLRITVGTTHSTNGVVGGTTTTFTPIDDASAAPVNGLWAACDGYGLILFHSYGGAGNAVIVIDRHREVDGSVLLRGGVSAGAFIAHQITTSNYIAHLDFLEPSLTQHATNTSYAPCITNGAVTTTLVTNLNDDGQTQVYPWWSVTKNSHGVSKMIATVAQADIASGTEQAVGFLTPTTARTYKVLGAYTPKPDSCDAWGTVSDGLGLAMWWED